MAVSKKPQKAELPKKNEDTDNSSEIVQIEQELTELNPKVFEGIPVRKKHEIIRTMVSIKHHSGPLPDPETLTQYNLVIPNGAERIMIMAEKQQEHRMSLETKAISSQLKQSGMGQNFGFALSLSIIVASVYLASIGHETTACVLGGATIVSLAIIFVLGKRPKSNAETKKSE